MKRVKIITKMGQPEQILLFDEDMQNAEIHGLGDYPYLFMVNQGTQHYVMLDRGWIILITDES